MSVPKTDGFGTGLLLAGAHYESLLPHNLWSWSGSVWNKVANGPGTGLAHIGSDGNGAAWGIAGQQVYNYAPTAGWESLYGSVIVPAVPATPAPVEEYFSALASYGGKNISALIEPVLSFGPTVAGGSFPNYGIDAYMIVTPLGGNSLDPNVYYGNFQTVSPGDEISLQIYGQGVGEYQVYLEDMRE
jgi:hypothetical protein